MEMQLIFNYFPSSFIIQMHQYMAEIFPLIVSTCLYLQIKEVEAGHFQKVVPLQIIWSSLLTILLNISNICFPFSGVCVYTCAWTHTHTHTKTMRLGELHYSESCWWDSVEKNVSERETNIRNIFSWKWRTVITYLWKELSVTDCFVVV